MLGIRPHNIKYQFPKAVITIDLELAWLRCSQRYIPCQMPKFNFPSVIGICTEAPNSDALIWAGISSVPS